MSGESKKKANKVKTLQEELDDNSSHNNNVDYISDKMETLLNKITNSMKEQLETIFIEKINSIQESMI